ncbi:SDR family NAD(P)-dependent oxidoreductase [[Mycobacterium] burgundiense]|uniref:SDR family oxidoreductase n=1 Tax=[Mycobacterium] burgundiense TaxID=3064286 RepID=A0ABM9LHU6_9MYCO|nr:SDR family oxidoreductase [Mycolicibacterium sp. MU0053]CAJ1499282.1 SDR family oxidoreductase [Mycolicibacterium sp. MU0053]
MTNLFDLSGRTALITGGSRGLGLAMARAFAAAGANVAIASRKREACVEVAESIAAHSGVKTWAFGCNVSSWDQCTELAEAADEATGGVDILVNNAGLSPLYPSLTEISEALYDKVFGVNTKGPFRLSTLLGEKMVARGRGSIINVSSIESVFPTTHALPYAAAKAALNTITQGLAPALGPSVRVNAILAGPFLTDIAEAWDMAAFQTMAERSIALRRGGLPDEIIGAAMYFASDASAFTTGALLRVDGGVVGGII